MSISSRKSNIIIPYIYCPIFLHDCASCVEVELTKVSEYQILCLWTRGGLEHSGRVMVLISGGGSFNV